MKGSNDELFAINVALSFADPAEVSSLLTEFGYTRDSVTPSLILEATKKHGVAFCKRLAQIAQKGLDSRNVNQILTAYNGLVYEDGTGAGITSTTTSKSDKSYAYFSKIFDFLGVGLTSASSIVDSLDVSGSKKATADATLAMAQAQLQSQQSSSNTKLYVAVGVIIAVILIVIVVLALRKR